MLLAQQISMPHPKYLGTDVFQFHFQILNYLYYIKLYFRVGAHIIYIYINPILISQRQFLYYVLNASSLTVSKGRVWDFVQAIDTRVSSLGAF